MFSCDLCGLSGWRLFLWPSTHLWIVLHCKLHCARSARPILTQTALHCRSAGGDLEHGNEIQGTVTNHQYQLRMNKWGLCRGEFLRADWITTRLTRYKQTNKQTSLPFENVLNIAAICCLLATCSGWLLVMARGEKNGDLHVLAWLHCWPGLQTRSGTREQNMHRGCVKSLSTSGIRAPLIQQLAKKSLCPEVYFNDGTDCKLSFTGSDAAVHSLAWTMLVSQHWLLRQYEPLPFSGVSTVKVSPCPVRPPWLPCFCPI